MNRQEKLEYLCELVNKLEGKIIITPEELHGDGDYTEAQLDSEIIYYENRCKHREFFLKFWGR